MKIFSTFAAILSAISIYAATAASAAATSSWTLGVGSNTCAEFLDASKDTQLSKVPGIERNGKVYVGQKSEYLEWAFGFISGRNTACYATYEKNTGEAFDAFLRHYCDKNPRQKFILAVVDFLQSEKLWETCKGPAN